MGNDWKYFGYFIGGFGAVIDPAVEDRYTTVPDRVGPRQRVADACARAIVQKDALQNRRVAVERGGDVCGDRKTCVAKCRFGLRGVGEGKHMWMANE
jgi:hypothetical protein